MKEKTMLTLAKVLGGVIVFVILAGALLELQHNILRAIGGIVVAGLFAYQLRNTIKHRNFGTFDKTSRMVWGGLIAVILIIILAGIVVFHSQSKPLPQQTCNFVNGKYGSVYVCK